MKKFETSEKYTVAQIFCSGLEDNGKIVIPDLQRDYCWGNEPGLVESFLDNLLTQYEMAEQPDELIMGLIYGYYESTRPNLLLCDGQQRLTTIFLLLGMLYRYTQKPMLRPMLMSQFEEEKDDWEPRLLYDIRESSKYFLSELVVEFFFSEANDKDTRLPLDSLWSSWWKKSYELDPTVLSARSAIEKIMACLQKMENLDGLAEFLTQRVKFIFYDMGDRKAGEETFVLINTSGEPLTPSENLKPILLSRYPDDVQEKKSIIWERIDNWFWRNRLIGKEDTSDPGFNEFMRRVAALSAVDKLEVDAYYVLLSQDELAFPSVIDDPVREMEDYFEIEKALQIDQTIKQLCPLLAKPLSEHLDLKEYFVVLPTLAFAHKFKTTLNEEGMISILRVYRYFENLVRYTDIEKARDNVRHALRAVEAMPSEDICSLLEGKKVTINRAYILTEEETKKLTILAKCPASLRSECEQAFWALQSTNSSSDVWEGKIGMVIDWAGGSEKFDLELFKGYSEALELLFQENRDLLRRILLTLGLDGYPGGDNYRNLTNEGPDFRRLFDKYQIELKAFVDMVRKIKPNSMESLLNQMIKDYAPVQPWAQFVIHPYLLEYTDHKNIWYDNNRGWILYQQQWARPLSVFNAHLLYTMGGGYNTSKEILPDWDLSHYSKAHSIDCLTLKNEVYQLEMDVYQRQDKCELILYAKEDKSIEEIAQELGFEQQPNNKWNLVIPVEPQNRDYNFLKSKIEQILSKMTLLLQKS